MVRALAILALAFLPGPVLACRLALLLAMDVSSSVNEYEDQLQRQGLAAALTAPHVVEAFLSDPYAPVALAVFEWSGGHRQTRIMDWRLIHDQADLDRAAETIRRSKRSVSEFPTAMGRAIGYASAFYKEAPVCLRRTLDISGDGANNDDFPPEVAYRHFPIQDVTVNALAIGTEEELLALIPYFRDEVIKGPGAFVEAARGFEDFPRAMAAKLRREVAAQVIGALDLAR